MSSIDYALQTLLLLGQRGQVGVSEVAKSLGVAPSTAHRTLAALCARQFAEQVEGSKMYALGEAVAELGFGARQNRELIPTARPFLERLTSLTRETSNLIGLSSRDVLFLDGVDGLQTLRVATRIGDRVPAHTTAAGKALLATLSRDRFEKMYSSAPLEKLTEQTITSLQDLEREIAKIARQGYALNEGEALGSVHAIGVPIPRPRGNAVAAITISMPSSRFARNDLDRLVQVLQEVAIDIALALRTSPPAQ